MDPQTKAKRAVLLVDDDQDRSVELSKLFYKRGYRTYRASTMERALKLTVEQEVVAVILALGSAAFDLKALRKYLNETDAYGDIPVLVLLKSFADDLVTSALKAGAADYLVWTQDADELITRTEVHVKLTEDDRSVTESLDQYKKHLGDDDIGLFFTNENGELLECNETLVKMLGYERKKELLHRKVAETIYFNPEEQKKFRSIIEKKGLVKDFRITFRRKGGEPISILISGQFVEDDNGDIADHPGEHIIRQEVDPMPTRTGLLPGLFHKLSDRFHSLFSAREIIGDRYEKIARLGIGAYGDIWKVRDIVKEPPEFLVAKVPLDTELNEKFNEEARILKALTGHTGVPDLREVIDVDNKRVLIQEFVEGQTLLKIIGNDFEEKELESVIIQLTDVVTHAHHLAIIHRDIKPGNIMVKPDGALKLLDFGAAKKLREEEISGTVIGSRPYMSPEQIMGQSQRGSDVWALGVVIYLLFTGRLPFYHHVEKILMDMILESPAPPPSKHKPDIDPELERIVMKCLQKSPANRYPDAGALKNDLLNTFPGFGKHIVPLY